MTLAGPSIDHGGGFRNVEHQKEAEPMGDTEIDPTAHTDEDRRTPLVREVEQGTLNTIPRYRCAPRQPLLSSPLSQGQSRCAQCIEGAYCGPSTHAQIDMLPSSAERPSARRFVEWRALDLTIPAWPRRKPLAAAWAVVSGQRLARLPKTSRRLVPVLDGPDTLGS